MQEIGRMVRRKEEKPMRWLHAPPAIAGDRDRDLREFMGGVREDIRALVGTHYYYIRCGAGGPALCRVDLYTRGRSPGEAIDHARFGITDDDLAHATRLDDGNAADRGYYRISDHIEGKLRALLDA